ncbi:HIT family protein [Nannocystis sp.]|uniref:HIT family protein n=1 Tax=Nannocystis sp. TaxID=1962667 RepID=UPI0025D77994|nr:HIT family protein [Nannocystis sp.]MBK7828177.1 HIT family protein [Nannocystis sp.]
MPTVFTRILQGELPARFVWKDELCAVFMSIAPLRPGHALVVPRAEVDHWIDLPSATAAHLMTVAQLVGRAQQAAFSPTRIGLMIAGFEVPHVHVHVVPVDGMRDLDFANADGRAVAAELEAAAGRLRAALRGLPGPESARHVVDA